MKKHGFAVKTALTSAVKAAWLNEIRVEKHQKDISGVCFSRNGDVVGIVTPKGEEIFVSFSDLKRVFEALC